MKYPRNDSLLPLARALRKNMTKEERRLWFEFLCFLSPRFRRQEIIGNYICDFICYEAALIVELDGSQHCEPAIQKKDRVRTEFLSSFGFTILRFSNLDVVEHFEAVCNAIWHYLETSGLKPINRSK